MVQPLPFRVARGLGSVGGLVMWVTQPRARTMSLRHAARIRGGDPDRVIGGDKRASLRRFVSYGQYFVETLWLTEARQSEITARFEVEGAEHLDKLVADGTGAVLAVVHVGNWDYAALYPLSIGLPIIAVAEDLADSEMTQWFIDMRAEAGIEIVLADGGRSSFVKLIRSVNTGRVVALLCDRDVTGTGVEVPFFGEKTKLPGGPVVLAAATGAPVIPIACYLTKGGHRFVAGPPMHFTREDTGEALGASMGKVATELEGLIRRAPHQWHVLQPNWPSDSKAI